MKAELQRGQMKAVKNFVQTCYSEILVVSDEWDEKDKDAKLKGDAGATDSMHLGGLGLKFKFPGDPRK